MATRSCIGIKHGDRIKAVYVHWDGYLDAVGKTLLDHYSDSVKLNQLISLGDLSSLGEEIGVKHPFGTIGMTMEQTEQYEAEHGNSCTFYGRDRGEDRTEFMSFGSEEDFVSEYDGRGCEYFYLYDHGVWHVKSYDSDFEPLHEAIAKEEAGAE